jgi:HEAT repeat protein
MNRGILAGILILVVAVGIFTALPWLKTPPAPSNSEGPPPKEIAVLMDDLKTDKDEVRLKAINQLADRGPAARAAVPALVDTFKSKNEDVRLGAALALGNIKTGTVPPLVEALKDRDADVRFYALWALGLVGPDAGDAKPAVAAALKDPSASVRRKAVFAVSKILPPDQAMPYLVAAFKDKDGDVRQEAVEMLVPLRAAGVPALVQALKEDDVELRRLVIAALGQIGPDAGEAAPALRAFLDPNKEPNSGGEATQALALIGKPALPVLLEALKDPNPQVRQQAFFALGQIGPASAETLVEAFKDPKPDVRLQAMQLLAAFGVTDRPVVQAVAELLKDRDATVRQQALATLENLPADPRDVAPVLLRLQTDPDAAISRTAGERLARYGAAVVPSLVEGLKNEEAAVRVAAAQALGKLGPAARDAVPALTEAEKDEKTEVQQAAKAALERIKGNP